MSSFPFLLSPPTEITNKKPTIGIPKKTVWYLKGNQYVPSGKEHGISAEMAWDSDMFTPMVYLKKSGIAITYDSGFPGNDNTSTKEKFVPSHGDNIWIVGMNGEIMTIKYNEVIHKQTLEFGNVFPDSKSALKAAIKINNLLGGALFNNRSHSKNPSPPQEV